MYVSRPKVRVPRRVENLTHSLAAYSDCPGDACHVLVLAALGGSNDMLGGEVVWPEMLRHSTESSMLNKASLAHQFSKEAPAGHCRKVSTVHDSRLFSEPRVEAIRI